MKHLCISIVIVYICEDKLLVWGWANPNQQSNVYSPLCVETVLFWKFTSEIIFISFIHLIWRSFCVSWRYLLVLLLTITFLVEIFLSHTKGFFLCKSAWRRVSMVNLQYKCVQMSAACKGSTSLVCRIMETCRLAALHSFLGSCVIERMPKLCFSVDLEQMKKEVSFAWAV